MAIKLKFNFFLSVGFFITSILLLTSLSLAIKCMDNSPSYKQANSSDYQFLYSEIIFAAVTMVMSIIGVVYNYNA